MLIMIMIMIVIIIIIILIIFMIMIMIMIILIIIIIVIIVIIIIVFIVIIIIVNMGIVLFLTNVAPMSGKVVVANNQYNWQRVIVVCSLKDNNWLTCEWVGMAPAWRSPCWRR